VKNHERGCFLENLPGTESLIEISADANKKSSGKPRKQIETK
jgi:hypothetical protein